MKLNLRSSSIWKATIGAMVPLLTECVIASGVGLATVPASASAYNFSYEYCPGLNFEPGETCPPQGNSREIFLYRDLGNAGGASNETCVDIYNEDTGKYSAADCMYYGTEEAV
ncbi:MAG: hypothetical protein ACYCX7_09810, partial [Solirubrobacteraceae bacterium]